MLVTAFEMLLQTSYHTEVITRSHRVFSNLSSFSVSTYSGPSTVTVVNFGLPLNIGRIKIMLVYQSKIQ